MNDSQFEGFIWIGVLFLYVLLAIEVIRFMATYKPPSGDEDDDFFTLR